MVTFAGAIDTSGDAKFSSPSALNLCHARFNDTPKAFREPALKASVGATKSCCRSTPAGVVPRSGIARRYDAISSSASAAVMRRMSCCRQIRNWPPLGRIRGLLDNIVRIVAITSVMVVVLLGWAALTLAWRGGALPPAPVVRNLRFSVQFQSDATIFTHLAQ